MSEAAQLERGQVPKHSLLLVSNIIIDVVMFFLFYFFIHNSLFSKYLLRAEFC